MSTIGAPSDASPKSSSSPSIAIWSTAGVGYLGWVPAGITLFAFAAPSAVQSAPFFVGGMGLLGGPLFCILITIGSIAGSWMLLQVKLQYPSAETFSDLGFVVFGPSGKFCGNLIQLGNFVLFLPCALLFTGQALAGIGHGISAFNPSGAPPCWDYYIFVIAAICFMMTQARTLNNTAFFARISMLSVFTMAITQLVAAFYYDAADKQPALLFGNPHGNERSEGIILWLRAATIPIFGYVPSFLTTELASCMEDPRALTKSLALSGFLNIAMFLGVGIPVVARWGYNLGFVAPLTGQLAGPGSAAVTAWDAGNVATNVVQIFALTGNFVSYMLDSVPLGRYCQRAWAPAFRDSWSVDDICRYLGYTLPTFLFGVAMAVFFPSLDLLIDVVTFATTPWVTMVFPSMLYWKFRRGARIVDLALLDSEVAQDAGTACTIKTSPRETLLIWGVFAIGILCFVISFLACVGKFWLNGTSDWQIGCPGWQILRPH